jgi:CRP/FNR family transcriptional regulator, cyclic AMP receptor protein
MSLICAIRSGSSATDLAGGEGRGRTIVPVVVTGAVTHTLVRALRAVPCFSELDDTSLCEIVGASSNLVWRAGAPIFEQGDPAEALYIVLSGTIRIVDEREREVARLGPGEFFGELSLLLDTNHSKSAEAVDDSELMVVPRRPFESLLAEDPALEQAVRRGMDQRLRSVEPQLRR